MYTEAAIQFYNLFYTSLPIILLGVYDMDIQREVIYRFPQLYEVGVKNLHFNVSNILLIIQIIFYYCY